jgi:selenocysteine-specific elongation factor
VLDVSPPPLVRRGAAAAAARQLSTWPDLPTAANLLARHGLMRASVLLAMGIGDHPRPVAAEWLADPDHLRSLSHQLGEVLAGHATAEPLSAGLPIEAARAALGLPDRRLVMALAKPPFRVSCGALQIMKPTGGQGGPDLPEPVLAAVRVLRADLELAPFASPDADRLRKLGLDARSIAAAARAGELMRISDTVVLAPGADVAAAAVLARLEQPFTAAQAREALGTTRRTAIPLLEYLDSAGVTERLADDRRIVRQAPAPPQPPMPAAGSLVAAKPLMRGEAGS